MDVWSICYKYVRQSSAVVVGGPGDEWPGPLQEPDPRVRMHPVRRTGKIARGGHPPGDTR